MAKSYWLGPENLRWKMGEPALRADDEMPGKVLEALGKERIKAFKESGKIGEAPKSAAIIRAQRNAQNALKVCLKEKAGALKKLEKASEQIEKLEEKLDDFNETKKELDAAETLNIKLEKALQAAEKVEDKLKKEIESLKAKLKKKGENG